MFDAPEYRRANAKFWQAVNNRHRSLDLKSKRLNRYMYWERVAAHWLKQRRKLKETL